MLLLSLTLGLAFSHTARADLDSGPLKIVASNYPLAYFAERIGGSRVKVTLPVPASEDPAFWKPDTAAIGQMQKADLIALNGAEYEKWLVRVSLPKLKQVDTSAGFKDRFIVIPNAVTHSHGPGGSHSHGGTAFTTWLDFAQAAQQAEALAQAMMRKRPEFKSSFAENLASLTADLKTLDSDAQRILGSHATEPLLASHPVYQYLAKRYGLQVESVHWEPGEMPSATEWEALQKLRAGHPAKIMLWEAEPSAEISAKLKSMGIRPVAFEPCANRPNSGDFLSMMKRNLDRLGHTP
ncbi:MAG: zinc ABC transporter substrate-binding protein [Methylococcaceae bacterium]|nr:zinc ABC transporter substrate-binding protein [Methylococcaceae bacterium]